MRLFTAIDISPEIVDRLSELISRWRPLANVRWSPPENLHITTKFIGEWPEERMEELMARLRQVPFPGPVTVGVHGLGWFPNARSPRVLWAGIQAPEALAGLARATEAELERLGIAAEKRQFSPHLTLARINPGSPLDRLRDAVQNLSSQDFGQFTVSRFYLYRSQLSRSGSIYTRVAGFPE